MYKTNMTSEIEDAVRRIQQEGNRKSEVRSIVRLCLICGEALSRKEEELGYGRCFACRHSISEALGSGVPLIVSVNGKSTLNEFREDQEWAKIDRDLRNRRKPG
ncbi:MAG: hypothetical protein SWH78_16085 [Thermodesulfobacteriota bacterium]|nr:hypothetical protein [Thermodesulfobacteriota bacterium]